MKSLNDMDNPDMDQELQKGDKVTWAEVEMVTAQVTLAIVRVGSSKMSFDYEVQTPAMNRFYVRHWEIKHLDGSPIVQ
jgi:hypothetical protein